MLIAELRKMTESGSRRDSSRFGRSIVERILVQDFLIEETIPELTMDVIAADCSLLAWDVEIGICLSLHTCSRRFADRRETAEFARGLSA